MAPLVRTGGSRHTGLAAPPHRNIQNGVQKAKDAADVLCDTNENDGVAKWIKENILSNQQ